MEYDDQMRNATKYTISYIVLSRVYNFVINWPRALLYILWKSHWPYMYQNLGLSDFAQGIMVGVWIWHRNSMSTLIHKRGPVDCTSITIHVGNVPHVDQPSLFFFNVLLTKWYKPRKGLKRYMDNRVIFGSKFLNRTRLGQLPAESKAAVAMLQGEGWWQLFSGIQYEWLNKWEIPYLDQEHSRHRRTPRSGRSEKYCQTSPDGYKTIEITILI